MHIIIFSNHNYLVEFLSQETQYSLKHYKLLEEFSIAASCDKEHLIIIDQDQESPDLSSLILPYKQRKIIFLIHSSNTIELISNHHYIVTKPIDLNKLLLLLQQIKLLLDNNDNIDLGNDFVLTPKDKKLINLKKEFELNLTEKEVSILEYLHKNPENTASKSELLNAVWHHNYELATHTVETHIYRLRQKLGKYAEILFLDNSKQGGGYGLKTSLIEKIQD